MKNIAKKLSAFCIMAIVAGVLALPAFAASSETAAADEFAATTEEMADQDATVDEVAADDATSTKAIAAGVAIAVVASAGALSMGLSISKSVDGISRQPEAAGNIRTAMMLGLVFIETAIIYALIVAILIVFVL